MAPSRGGTALKTLLLAAAATLVLASACSKGTPRPDQAMHDACWVWSTAYLGTVQSLARDLRADDAAAAAFLIGGNDWPPTAGQRVVIANAGYHACMEGLAASFDGDAGYHVACERQARTGGLQQAAVILDTQARRAGVAEGTSPGAMPTARLAAASYARGYAVCMADHAP